MGGRGGSSGMNKGAGGGGPSANSVAAKSSGGTSKMPEQIPYKSTKELSSMSKSSLQKLAMQSLIRTTMETANKYSKTPITQEEAIRRINLLGGAKGSTASLIKTIRKQMKKKG